MPQYYHLHTHKCENNNKFAALQNARTLFWIDCSKAGQLFWCRTKTACAVEYF